MCVSLWLYKLFFFQAEDGIRDYKVTGVQTCALPIWRGVTVLKDSPRLAYTLKTVPSIGAWMEHFPIRSCTIFTRPSAAATSASARAASSRSEERRVGKERTFQLGTYVCNNRVCCASV